MVYSSNGHHDVRRPLLLWSVAVKYLGLICVLVINDDPYFWSNKFIEMVVVLVKIRKRFSQRYCLWMTQGKGIFIGFFYFTGHDD
jgi:hypothetical protein